MYIFKLTAMLFSVVIFIVIPISAMLKCISKHVISAKSSRKSLPTTIETKNFKINIDYEILENGNIQATLKTVKHPKGIHDVIHTFEGHTGYTGYINYTVIERKTVESMSIRIKNIIIDTWIRIQEIEENLETLEFNDILSEVGG